MPSVSVFFESHPKYEAPPTCSLQIENWPVAVRFQQIFHAGIIRISENGSAWAKHLILGLCLGAVACTQNTTPNPMAWKWRGKHVLCSQLVDFAADSRRKLPEFDAKQGQGFCRRTVFYLRLHREFGEDTTFFGVAAMTTSGLVVLDRPTQHHRYSPETWAFMSGLSLELEERAEFTAQRLRRGRKGSDLTQRLLTEEQAHVGRALANLQRSDPALYRRVIREIDRTLNPGDPLVLAAINSHPFFATYLAAIAKVRGDVGGPVSFALSKHRVAVGMALSKSFTGGE